jgi:hypothetical protein
LVVGERVPGDVIEEEDGLGTAGEHVVHAVPEDVRAAEVKTVGCELHLHLRANAVGAGGEHRVAVLLAEAEQPAEGPRVAQHLRPASLGEDARQALREPAAGGDVHARGGVLLPSLLTGQA